MKPSPIPKVVLRRYAAAALQGLLAHEGSPQCEHEAAHLAERAWDIALSMVEQEREVDRASAAVLEILDGGNSGPDDAETKRDAATVTTLVPPWADGAVESPKRRKRK